MNIKLVLAMMGIMTLCLVATKPLANQAFAKKPCESLTLKANPGSVAHTPSAGGRVPVGTPQLLTGKLICGGKGNSDATIDLLGSEDGKYWFSEQVRTDSSGNFQLSPGPVVFSPHSYTITAKYAGDGIYEAANPARIKITTTPQG